MKSDKDLISELPDGILHNIIHRLKSEDQAAQTIAISRRWETLWRSYPFVEFDIRKSLNCNRDFQKFAEATINRFTRDSLLRMEILKLSLIGVIDEDSFVLYSPLVEQLVDLASRRKAEKVSIFAIRYDSGYPHFCLPCRLLSDSAAKTLQLSGIELKRGNDPLPHSLKFLRTLYIDNVVLEDERILGSLIACSSKLETMELFGILNLSKLQVSNLPKLRTLRISFWEGIKEIEIAAPQLHTLYLWSEFRCKIELTAPQLHHLEISYEVAVAIAAVLSKLPSLKSLIIRHSGYDQQDATTLRLSVPKLEELTIINPYKLSNIHIDGGPYLTKFSLEYDESCPEDLQKCEINHAGACRWALHIATEPITYGIDPQRWFPLFKNFMVRYPQFRTVYIDNINHNIIAFDQNEVDNSVLPTAIDHLVVNGYVSSDDGNFNNFLDGLLWACRPKFICLRCSNSSEILLEEFSSWYLLAKNSEKGGKEHCHRLKDAKIATEEEMKEEFRSFSKDMITLLYWGVWLMLTWY